MRRGQPPATDSPKPFSREPRATSHERRLSPLNAILDDDAATRAGWSVLDLGRACLDGGATFLQLRAKQRSSAWLLETAEHLVAMAAPANALVVINDRADIARLAAGAGVHVGQDDLAPAAVRRLIGADRLVGFSTHTVAQLDDAVLLPIDYVAIGPVFGTASKDTGYDAVGLTLVKEAAARAHARRLPVVAIGGITLDNVTDVINAGATSAAVISDLLAGRNPRARVRQYLDKLSQIGGL